MALQDDALRLIELGRQVDRAIKDLRKDNFNEFVRALAGYVTLRASLQRRMLDEDVDSSEDSRARDVLHKIATGEGLEADRFVKAFGEITDNPDLAAFGELDDAKMEELGSDLFYSWYSHYEYVEALGELRPLIPGCDVSPTVKRLVGEARQCYAFQQYDATSTMCRVLLEAGTRDICEQLGLIRRSSKSYKDDWSRLLGKVTFELGIEEALKKKLKRLYGDLCTVAHAERQATTRTRAHTEFLATLSALEELYTRRAAKPSERKDMAQLPISLQYVNFASAPLLDQTPPAASAPPARPESTVSGRNGGKGMPLKSAPIPSSGARVRCFARPAPALRLRR